MRERSLARSVASPTDMPSTSTSREAKGGAVALIQRFGSATNLNIHLHALVLDGVYRQEEEAVVFHASSSPTEKEITAVLGQIVTHIMALLTRVTPSNACVVISSARRCLTSGCRSMRRGRRCSS